MTRIEAVPFTDEHLDAAAELLAARHVRHRKVEPLQEPVPVMTTDWRVTNLWASRFWPKRGFRTAFLRLYRSIP